MLEPFLTIEPTARWSPAQATSRGLEVLRGDVVVENWADHLPGGDLVRHGVSTIDRQTTHHFGGKATGLLRERSEEAVGWIVSRGDLRTARYRRGRGGWLPTLLTMRTAARIPPPAFEEMHASRQTQSRRRLNRLTLEWLIIGVGNGAVSRRVSREITRKDILRWASRSSTRLSRAQVALRPRQECRAATAPACPQACPPGYHRACPQACHPACPPGYLGHPLRRTVRRALRDTIGHPLRRTVRRALRHALGCAVRDSLGCVLRSAGWWRAPCNDAKRASILHGRVRLAWRHAPNVRMALQSYSV